MPRKKKVDSLLDAEKQAELLAYLRVGAPLRVAVASVGLSWPIISEWLTQAESLLKTTASTLSATDLQIRTFYQAVMEAIADCELQQINRIETAASMDWKAAVWILENRFPRKYKQELSAFDMDWSHEEVLAFLSGTADL